MLTRCLAWLRQRLQHGVDALRTLVGRWTTPRPVALAAGLAADAVPVLGGLHHAYRRAA